MAMKKQKMLTCCNYEIDRKHLSPLRLFAFSIITFLALLTQIGFAQDCKTQAANKPSTLATVKNVVSASIGEMSASQIAKRKPHLAKAEKWVKNIVTNFTGAKLVYYDNFYPDFVGNGETHRILYQATGIKTFYSSQMQFFAYYCYDDRNTIFTEGESGSNIQVVFNNVFTVGFTDSEGVHTVNAKPAFTIIQKKRSEGRIDFYEQRTKNNADAKMYTVNDFIILRNSDKPVFLPITRKEYLEQILKDLEDFKAKEIASAKLAYTPANETQNKARFDEDLKRIDNSKNYTKEQMASYRRRFIETWETEKQKYDKRIVQVEKGSYEARKVMLEYLKKPTEWLNRNVSDFYPFFPNYTAEGVRQYFEGMDKPTLNGVGEVEEVTQTEIVSVNPAYFNKTLSDDVPQLLMVHLENGSYAHMLKVGSRVKQPNALTPLEAILNSQ